MGRMEKISFYIRTSRNGQVKVRYRIRDGRDIQLMHKTDIKCSEVDLSKLNPDGSTKGKIHVYNTDLSNSLKEEYRLMNDAYTFMRDQGLGMTSDVLERQIEALRNPVTVVRKDNPTLVDRFRKYASDALSAGILGEKRYKHIIVVSDKLYRFLVINGLSRITSEEFDVAHLMDFRDFLFDEYQYVDKYPKLYKEMKEKNRPTARLSMNTVTSQLKMFQTFFSELEDLEEIKRSPFRKLGKEKRKAVMKTKYDDPFFLRQEELFRILDTKVMPSLQETKDAFLVQCAFGCRISDYVLMSMDTVAVSEEGIPYIHYIPLKTADAQEGNTEVETPIVRYAFDIIMRTGFDFPILRNIYGATGYNTRIKSLLQQCKIDRLVAQYNEETRRNEYLPLYKVASSKLARKTHVDMMTKVQVNMYAAGLHKVGSSAVTRYTSLELKDRFMLLNAAFGQELYYVDNELNIL